MKRFSGVTMAWSEAYTAMNSGIIDAVEVPLQNIYEQGFYDLGKYVLMTGHIFTANCIMANGAFMDSLPQVYQDIIRDAAAEAEAEWRAEAQNREQGYIDSLKAEGVTFNEWDSASYEELTAKFSEYWIANAEAISPKAVEYVEAILACK